MFAFGQVWSTRLNKAVESRLVEGVCLLSLATKLKHDPRLTNLRWPDNLKHEAHRSLYHADYKAPANSLATAIQSMNVNETR